MKAPLAGPTVEIAVDESYIKIRFEGLAGAMSRMRLDAPELGLMLVVHRSTGPSFYAWKHSASADEVLAGIRTLVNLFSPGSFGWDPQTSSWIRV